MGVGNQNRLVGHKIFARKMNRCNQNLPEKILCTTVSALLQSHDFTNGISSKEWLYIKRYVQKASHSFK